MMIEDACQALRIGRIIRPAFLLPSTIVICMLFHLSPVLWHPACQEKQFESFSVINVDKCNEVVYKDK